MHSAEFLQEWIGLRRVKHARERHFQFRCNFVCRYTEVDNDRRARNAAARRIVVCSHDCRSSAPSRLGATDLRRTLGEVVQGAWHCSGRANGVRVRWASKQARLPSLCDFRATVLRLGKASWRSKHHGQSASASPLGDLCRDATGTRAGNQSRHSTPLEVDCNTGDVAC
jgi:hypothetical protein